MTTEERPSISKEWEFSNVLRMIEGVLVIVVSVIFILQSSAVIDLWLNFAGVTFVGLLDDTAFVLAQNRLLGKTAMKLTDRVSDVKV